MATKEIQVGNLAISTLSTEVVTVVRITDTYILLSTLERVCRNPKQIEEEYQVHAPKSIGAKEYKILFTGIDETPYLQELETQKILSEWDKKLNRLPTKDKIEIYKFLIEHKKLQ